jgi:hypothetical protein
MAAASVIVAGWQSSGNNFRATGRLSWTVHFHMEQTRAAGNFPGRFRDFGLTSHRQFLVCLRQDRAVARYPRIPNPFGRLTIGFNRYHFHSRCRRMAFSSEMLDRRIVPGDSPRAGEIYKHAHLISPPIAWRILHRRTGGHVSRSTFYRWLESGKVYSLRIGSRMYIPWQALQDVIVRCLNGDPL